MSIFSPKIAREDFDEKKLPSTRKEIFFDVLKLHWFTLLVCGFVLFAGALPFTITGIADHIARSALYSAVASGEITQAQAFASAMSIHIVLCAVDIFGCVIFGLCLAAVSQAIKLLAWEEPCRISSALLKGLKQNGRQYLILSLLFGFFWFACRYAVTANGSSFFGYLPAIACLLIPAPIAAYILVSITLYDIKFSQQIRYALLAFVSRKLKTMAAYLIALIPFVLIYLSDTFLGLTVSVIVKSVLFVLIPFFLLGWFLFAFNSFDTAINQKYYPELVGRGLNLIDYENDKAWLEY